MLDILSQRLTSLAALCLQSPLHPDEDQLTLTLILRDGRLPMLAATHKPSNGDWEPNVNRDLQSDLEMTFFQGDFTRPALRRKNIEPTDVRVSVHRTTLSAHDRLNAMIAFDGPLHGIA